MKIKVTQILDGQKEKSIEIRISCIKSIQEMDGSETVIRINDGEGLELESLRVKESTSQILEAIKKQNIVLNNL